MPDLSEVVLSEVVPLQQIVFWVMTALTLIGGAGVVTSRSLFHSALFLVMSFGGVTGYYIILSAGFLAVVQLTVYIGAIAILILFAIMFSRRSMTDEVDGQSNKQWWYSMPIVSILFFVLVFVIGTVEWPITDTEPTVDMVEQIGLALLGGYLIPFQVIGILLSVALIGGVILARDHVEGEEAES